MVEDLNRAYEPHEPERRGEGANPPSPSIDPASAHETEEIRFPDGRIEHPTVRHEAKDVSFRWILGTILGLAIVAVVLSYALFRLFNAYGNYQAEIKKSPYPLATSPSTSLPQEPRLEQLERSKEWPYPKALQLPGSDISQGESNVSGRQASEESILNSYGPTKEKGFVHIPIDRAMTIIVEEKKLPVRKEARP